MNLKIFWKERFVEVNGQRFEASGKFDHEGLHFKMSAGACAEDLCAALKSIGLIGNTAQNTLWAWKKRGQPCEVENSVELYRHLFLP